MYSVTLPRGCGYFPASLIFMRKYLKEIDICTSVIFVGAINPNCKFIGRLHIHVHITTAYVNIQYQTPLCENHFINNASVRWSVLNVFLPNIANHGAIEHSEKVWNFLLLRQWCLRIWETSNSGYMSFFLRLKPVVIRDFKFTSRPNPGQPCLL